MGEIELLPMIIPILYRNEYLLVVNKPSGLLTHPSQEARKENDLTSLLKSQLQSTFYPIHRLDRATSGIVCFASKKEYIKPYQQLWTQQQVFKEYLCLVRGQTLPQFSSCYPLTDLEKNIKREATTDFITLKNFKNISLIKAIPRTGRTHQIRRHLAHLGHHIIGDTTYGKGGFNRQARSKGLNRLFLHASVIQFIDPLSFRPLMIFNPLSADLIEHLKINALDSLHGGS